jgi:hypothetical protein
MALFSFFTVTDLANCLSFYDEMKGFKWGMTDSNSLHLEIEQHIRIME